MSESSNFISIESCGRHPIFEKWIEYVKIKFAKSALRYNQYVKHKKCKNRSPKERMKNLLLKCGYCILELRMKKSTTDRNKLQYILSFLQTMNTGFKSSKEELKKLCLQSQKIMNGLAKSH